MPYYHKETKKYLQNTLKTIEQKVYLPLSKLKVTAYWSPEPVSFKNKLNGKKKNLVVGQKWGNLFDCAWFHFTGNVPSSAAGKKVVLLIDVNGEAVVVDKQGNPVLGLTNVASSYDFTLGMPGKCVVPITTKAKGGESIDIWADAGCNDLFGVLQRNGTLKEASIAICHEEMRQLYYDFEVLHELMTLIPEDKARHHTILAALNDAANQLSEYTEEEAKKARAILALELKKKGGDPSLRVSALGHAHIDLGWLWPIRETIRKGARTFSTVIEMMNRYPDYHFGASQPQLYQWMKDYYPALYAKIKKRVADGRWEAQGCTWVEADINLSGGEALVRQIIYGKKFFRNEFGKEMKILWQPDVFGYIGTLPQLLKKSDVDYFMTQKLSWSLYNVFPHHTFHWQGIDGSKVLSHMPPEATYNSSAAPRSIYKSEKEFIDKSVSDRCLLLFGIGDGGGGPGEEHLERLLREKNLDGLAPCIQESSEKFFKRLEKNQAKYKTWSGELYLERHQGTLTTQARNKRANRKLEIALRELEHSAVLASAIVGSNYPKGELDKIWKEMLLYQFHDILPGSSITRVYDESLARYKVLSQQVEELTKKADAKYVTKIDTTGLRNPVVVTNSLSWERVEWKKIEGKWFKIHVPPMGYTTIDLEDEQHVTSELSASSFKMENDILSLQFNKDGYITSIFDKENHREILPPGQIGNQLNVYDDNGDAWDFQIGYDEKTPKRFKLKSSKAKVDGPCAILHQVFTFGKSTLTQDIILREGKRRIDFVTEVDWKEDFKMLRTAFPMDIQADEATCDIQFGNIKRPTHRNTSWDMGKFEICAHKWIDISQSNYGVALLNDCKYGHKVVGNILDLNLLRSPKFPDPVADRAKHQFTYSLYPHAGDHVKGEVVRKGYELNIPLRTISVKPTKGYLPAQFSFVYAESDNIVIEAVKRAETNNDFIFRLYESTGTGTRTKLHFKCHPKSIRLVNLMEEHPQKLNVDDNVVELNFKPFEILTVRITV